MEGAPKVKKEVTEHSLLKDETQNSMRRIIPIENYRRMIWGRRTEQFWASLSGGPGSVTQARIQALQWHSRGSESYRITGGNGQCSTSPH